MFQFIAAFIAAFFIVALTPAGAQNNWPTPGGAQANGAVQMCVDGSGNARPCQSYSYTNITTDTTTAIKSGAGVLHSICINTPAATGVVTIYDNTAASGSKIGTITSFASMPACFLYDAAFTTGLTVVTGTAAPDVTVTWR